jgi:hypothetical protein
MSSQWKTGSRSEALHALPVVIDLAKETLDISELEEAENTAFSLVGSKRLQYEARSKLRDLVAPPPKRPLYYLQHEIQFLPRWTRDSIRYCGDYIDLLLKIAAYERHNDPRMNEYSLGKNINILSSKINGFPEPLINKLKKYNSFLYRPGKHDFTLPARRGHRFTSREVVLTAFITMKLAKEIRTLSENAERIHHLE